MIRDNRINEKIDVFGFTVLLRLLDLRLAGDGTNNREVRGTRRGSEKVGDVCAGAP